MPGEGGTSRRRAALAAGLLAGLAGAAIVAIALAANRDWAGRHFLPTFAWSRAFQLGIVQALRLLLGMIGLAIILFVRPRVARAVAAGRARSLLVSSVSSALAIAAAFGATEAILHTRTWHSTQERWGKEPLRRRDPLLGWSFVPSHDGRATGEGRAIGYAIDPLGTRVRSAGDRLDPGRPTIIFAGESILFGYGLPWQDTIQARVEALTGLQVANLSVNAYATDQSYIRLRRELPRFAHPVAIVVPFVPMLFDRMLDKDRPHLDARLRWHAGRPPPLRLVELARRVLRYRSEASIAEGVATTQAVLRATLAAARARGAAALIVVPQFQPEDATERAVRQRVLDAAHIPYLLVPLDPGWRLAADRHPDARGAAVIAAAISRALARNGN